ncbi:MAG: glycosyltransferase family 4 protein [Candidatus Pacebacteria bacterium]|nr:glycosyltransferase family 4 protein [Candidatus Paceibacterota bacterium]
MKKILIFSLDYLPGTISGAESAIQDITDRIPSQEIEFHMVTMHYDSKVPRVQKFGNVTCYYVGLFGKPDATLEERKRFPLHYNKHYFQIAAGIKGWWLHRKHHFDGAWAMMAHGTGVPVSIFNILTGVPYALSLQEGDPPEYIEKTMRPLWPLFKRAFTHATVLQAISHFLGDWGVRMGHKKSVVLIRDGANPDNLNPNFTPEEAETVRQKLGKKEGDVFLLIAARLVEQKGIDSIIRALALLPIHIKFVVIGSGPLENELKDLAKMVGVADRVIWLGQIERSEVPKYRNTIVADIFVHPSRSEGLGHTCVSAMAGHLPVIATQVGGLGEYIIDEDRNPEEVPTAFAVDPDNPKQIAAAVKKILDNPEKTKRVVENAYQMVLEEYDWDMIAVKMKEQVFDRLWS